MIINDICYIGIVFCRQVVAFATDAETVKTLIDHLDVNAIA